MAVNPRDQYPLPQDPELPTPELEVVPPQPGAGATENTWEELGAGNPERRHLASLLESFAGDLEAVKTKLGFEPSAYEDPDDTGVQIYNALHLIGGLGNAKVRMANWNSSVNLKNFIAAQWKEIGANPAGRKLIATRAHSSVQTFRNFRERTRTPIPDRHTVVELIHESNSPVLQGAAPELLAARYRADAVLDVVVPDRYKAEAAHRHNGDATDDFLRDLQDELATEFTEAKPRPGRDGRAKYAKSVAKAKRKAA